MRVPLLLPYSELFCRKQLQPWHLPSDFRIPLHPKKPPQMKLKELLVHKHLIKRLQFLIGSFPCVQAHSCVWLLRPESCSLLCSVPAELPGTRGSRGIPEGPTFTGRLQAGAVTCSQQHKAGEGQACTAQAGFIMGEKLAGHMAQLEVCWCWGSQRWRGCSQEGQEGRTPLPSHSLEIAWLPPRALLAGGVDQPCALCTYV